MINDKRVYLWDNILNKLENVCKRSLRYECDIRYLNKWILLYPQCFPKFMVNNHDGYIINFNNELLRYEILKKL